MKMDPPAVCVLHTLLVLMILPPVASVPCPRPCSCPKPTELHCTFRSLITIPAAVFKHVERMNLGSVLLASSALTCLLFCYIVSDWITLLMQYKKGNKLYGMSIPRLVSHEFGFNVSCIVPPTPLLLFQVQ